MWHGLDHALDRDVGELQGGEIAGGGSLVEVLAVFLEKLGILSEDSDQSIAPDLICCGGPWRGLRCRYLTLRWPTIGFLILCGASSEQQG